MGKSELEQRMKILERGRKSGNVYNGFIPKEKKKKTHERKLSSEAVYNLTLMHFQLHLYELICQINDIPLDYYMISSKERVELVNNLKLDETFKNLSKLDWDEPMPIDGLYFRGRFATCVLYRIVRVSHKLVKQIFSYTSDEDEVTKKKRFKNFQYILDNWIQIVDGFVLSYLSSNINYVPYLRKIEELLSCIEEGGGKKIQSYLDETEALILDGDEPGIEANNITKMAYVLATGSDKKLKKCPEYDEYYSYDNDEATLAQIGGLGYAVLNRRMNGDAKLPYLYRAFQEANPKIVSRFYQVNEDAPELTVGLKVLEFSKLFYGDEVRKQKLIDKIM